MICVRSECHYLEKISVLLSLSFFFSLQTHSIHYLLLHQNKDIMRISLPLVGIALSLSLVIASPAPFDHEDDLAIPKFEDVSSHMREAIEAAKQDPKAEYQVKHDSDDTSVEHSSSVYHNHIAPLNTMPSVPLILRKRDKKNKQANTLVGGIMQKGLIGFNPKPDPTAKPSSKQKKKGQKPPGLTGSIGNKVFGSGTSSVLKKQALRFKQPSTGKKKGGSNDPPIMINPASNSGIVSIEGQSLGPLRYGTTQKAPEP